MKKQKQIKIGQAARCFIIAEIGVNHNGSLKLAKKLIDKAKTAGVDAVKFQTFTADNLVAKSAKLHYRMLKKRELSNKDFISLAKYAAAKKIIFLSSPFDETSVNLLEEIEVPLYKIGSGEITNHPLLKCIAMTGKPIILSTGMATFKEIATALKTIKRSSGKQITLLHCLTSYPANIKDLNLRVINTLEKRFGLPVGFSDHSLSVVIPAAAVALGACVIEKHFTLDKKMIGPDHSASLEPDELKQMVVDIRQTELALGNGIKKITREEEKIKKIGRKSIVADVNIIQDSFITKDMLACKRPGIGLEPFLIEKIIGRRAKKSIAKDELIKWSMIKK